MAGSLARSCSAPRYSHSIGREPLASEGVQQSCIRRLRVTVDDFAVSTESSSGRRSVPRGYRRIMCACGGPFLSPHCMFGYSPRWIIRTTIPCCRSRWGISCRRHNLPAPRRSQPLRSDERHSVAGLPPRSRQRGGTGPPQVPIMVPIFAGNSRLPRTRSATPDRQPYVLTDGLPITGQNPA